MTDLSALFLQERYNQIVCSRFLLCSGLVLIGCSEQLKLASAGARLKR